MTTSIAIIATEGFGSLPISADAFAFLKKFEGTRVTMITTTRMSGFLGPAASHLGQPGKAGRRCTRAADLPDDRYARPAGGPGQPRNDREGRRATEASATADGVAVDVMTIMTPDNKSRVVAANNVEVIA